MFPSQIGLYFIVNDMINESKEISYTYMSKQLEQKLENIRKPMKKGTAYLFLRSRRWV